MKVAALWIYSIKSSFRRETSQNDDFSVQNVLETNASVLFTEWPEVNIFNDQERPEKNRTTGCQIGWLLVSAGKPGRTVVAAVAARCGVLTRRLYKKRGQHA